MYVLGRLFIMPKIKQYSMGQCSDKEGKHNQSRYHIGNLNKNSKGGMAMIYSVNLLDLTEKVNPLSFSKYLRDTGWNHIPRKNDKIRVYQIIANDGNLFQVTIPIDKTLSDYKIAMYEAIESVAFVEERSPEQVMLFLLNPNTDILKIRLDRKDVEAGNIFFDDAIRIYENTKKLLAAAAQDVLHPRQYHRGRIDDSILRFISNCRFGQTEIGSYIVSVVCPFVELNEADGYQQLSIFSDEEKCAESLTRLVANRIMTNISNIKQHIDNGDENKLVSDDGSTVISANFYEALAGLNLDISGANVEFFAQWSPTVKKTEAKQTIFCYLMTIISQLLPLLIRYTVTLTQRLESSEGSKSWNPLRMLQVELPVRLP